MNKKKLLCTWLLVWLIPIAIFWIFKGIINPMLYSIVFLYGWYPISACVISYLIGERDYFGKLKWIAPILIGVMNGLVWCVTFGLANTLSSGNLNPPHMEDILFHTVPAIIGFVVGVVMRLIMKPAEKERKIEKGSLRGLWICVILWCIPIVVFLITSNFVDTAVIYLVALFVWYPILSGGVSFIVGRNAQWGMWKWFSPALFGVMGGIALRLMRVLDASVNQSLILEGVNEFLWNIVASIIGLVIGVVVFYIVNRRKTI